jgi:hypothetical protein
MDLQSLQYLRKIQHCYLAEIISTIGQYYTETFLTRLGLIPGGEAWEAALQGNGHRRNGMPIVNGLPCRL